MDTVRLVFFLKPDAVIRRYVGARTLKTLITKVKNLKFLTFEEISPAKEFLAEQHYGEHKGKFFFDWLVDFTISAPIYFIMIETYPENISKIREILGPTLVQKAAEEAPGTIRGKYGIYGGVNVAHASDSLESAKRESKIWEEYLREHHGIDVNNANEQAVLEKIESYINSYIDYPIIDNTRYMELSIELSMDPSKKEEIKRKFIELLEKETSEDFRTKRREYLENLADILIRNALLRK